MGRGRLSKGKKAQEAAEQKQKEKDEAAKTETPKIRRKKKTGPKMTESMMSIMATLNEIRTEIDELVKEHEDYVISHKLVKTGNKILPQDNKSLYIYEESLLRMMIRLDGVFVDHQVLRDTRKRVILQVQEHLAVLDAYKADPASEDLPKAPPRKAKSKSGNYLGIIALIIVIAMGSAGLFLFK